MRIKCQPTLLGQTWIGNPHYTASCCGSIAYNCKKKEGIAISDRTTAKHDMFDSISSLSESATRNNMPRQDNEKTRQEIHIFGDSFPVAFLRDAQKRKHRANNVVGLRDTLVRSSCLDDGNSCAMG